jgi:hypothetical protein
MMAAVRHVLQTRQRAGVVQDGSQESGQFLGERSLSRFGHVAQIHGAQPPTTPIQYRDRGGGRFAILRVLAQRHEK